MMELPEEIITKILEFTCEPDKSNFENMATTCKSIRRISRGHQFTDYFKCQDCIAIETALENDHLTCYKWHFNKMVERKIDQLCIDASRLGSLKVVKYLVSSGANIHADSDYAVRWASRSGHLEIVKYLVSLGANINANDDYAVRWALINGHLGVVKYLVSSGANIHADDNRAVRWASQQGHIEVVQYLVSLEENNI